MQSKKITWLIIFLLSLSLALLLAACGGGAESESDSPPAEKTVEQESAQSDNATKPDSSKPQETGANAPEVETAAQQTTTVYQAAQLLDLRDLPLPDGATPMGIEVGYLTYQAPLNVAGVVDHYRPLLTGQGWQENSEQAYVDNTTATLYFAQKGYHLNLSASDMGTGNTLVTLQNNGNIDLAALPQAADAEEGFSAPNTLIYFSPSAVTDVATFTRQELAAQGWHIYTRPNTATADNSDSQSLAFIQNGLELSAFISTAPAQDNKTSVQYAVRLLPLDLPVDDQAVALEFDEHEPFLSYQTSTSRDALTDFYQKQMAAAGWMELPDLTATGEEQVNLAFANDAEQLALLVGLAAAPDNQTQVTLRSLSSEDMLADAGDTTADTSGDATADSSGDLSSFPLPADAQSVAYDAAEITFSSPSDVETVVEFYRDFLSADGWQEQTDFSQVDDTFAFVEFDRAGEVIYVTLISFSGSSEATIDLSEAPSLAGSAGDEETETEITVDPNAPAYTINDWPTPPEATDVKLSGTTLSYKISWDLPTLAEFYLPTFELMELGTSCLEDVGDYTSISCSSSNGYVSLNFFAFEGFDDTEVEIDFTNYAVDSGDDSSGGSGSGELAVIDQDGLPLPNDYTGYSSEQSTFRRGLTFTSPSDIPTLKELYKTELGALGWQATDGSETGGITTLIFSGPEGAATLTLKPSGGETEGSLFIKDSAAAKEAGILPSVGQARLYLVNFSDGELTVQINNQTIKIPAGAGMESPDDAPKMDLAPGSYAVKTTAGGSSVTDEVIVGADEVWSLLLDKQGALPLQMY